jgi:hypothetical protein
MHSYDLSQLVAAKMTRKGKRRVRRTAASRSHEQQLQLPLEESDIRVNSKLRGVYRDRNGRHALVYKVGKARISFIEMKRGTLTTQSLPDSKFFDLRQFERIAYAIECAVADFLKHEGGVSEPARRALKSALKP